MASFRVHLARFFRRDAYTWKLATKRKIQTLKGNKNTYPTWESSNSCQAVNCRCLPTCSCWECVLCRRMARVWSSRRVSTAWAPPRMTCLLCINRSTSASPLDPSSTLCQVLVNSRLYLYSYWFCDVSLHCYLFYILLLLWIISYGVSIHSSIYKFIFCAYEV